MIYVTENVDIEHASGAISRMQLVADAPVSAFDEIGAANAGFLFDAEAQRWKRTLDDAAIEREISKTIFPSSHGKALAWKRMP